MNFATLRGHDGIQSLPSERPGTAKEIISAALIAGSRPGDPSLILGHSASMSLSNYNRARNIEASRAHDERITALEDSPPRARRLGPVSRKPSTPKPRTPPARKRAANQKGRSCKAV